MKTNKTLIVVPSSSSSPGEVIKTVTMEKGRAGDGDEEESVYQRVLDYQSQSEVPAPNASQEILGLLKLDPDEMMPQIFFRLIHRARSKSQRRRVYSWVAVCLLLIFMLLYSQQDYITALVERHSRHIPIEVVTTKANLAFPNNVFRGADMKLLQTKDSEQSHDNNNNNNNNINGVNNINNNINNNNNVNKLQTHNFNYMYENLEDESRSDLLPDLAPSIVHFVWCGKGRFFEFRHYLAVKRANNLIKPDKILFHYSDLPLVDSVQYYDWFNHSLSEIDHMVLRPLNVTRCDSAGPHKYMLVLSLLESFGGIFIPEDALLVDFPVHLRKSPFISGVVAKTMSDYMDGIIVAKKNGFISPASQNGLNVVLASGRSETQGMIPPCGDRRHFNKFEQGECVCVKIDTEIYPSSIWSEKSNFSTLARVASYGTPIVEAAQGSVTMIPRIGHYICWDCDIKFNTYLSVMSSLHVAGLSKVYIHGLKEPSGYWWKMLQATLRVVHVNREYPVHSRNSATMTQELAQGIMRINILSKYGGVYCDNKVIWTNAIPEHYFEYDAVASPDWHQLGVWPDAISHTTIMAKKNADYLVRLRNLHHQYPKMKFWFVDSFLSYKILEHDPKLLYLDRHLQVKCLNHNCHPTWVPGYKAPMDENPPGPSFSWQNDTLSLYWDVFPPLELDTVKYTSGLVVEAARRALHMGGVAIQDLAKH